MRVWLVLMILGVAALVWPIAAYTSAKRVQANDARAVAALRGRLDSLRAVRAQAATAADSTLSSQQVRAQEEGLGRRAYHLTRRQAQLDGWWRVPGAASLSVTMGAMMLAVGVVALLRKNPGPD